MPRYGRISTLGTVVQFPVESPLEAVGTLLTKKGLLCCHCLISSKDVFKVEYQSREAPCFCLVGACESFG